MLGFGTGGVLGSWSAQNFLDAFSVAGLIIIGQYRAIIGLYRAIIRLYRALQKGYIKLHRGLLKCYLKLYRALSRAI